MRRAIVRPCRRFVFRVILCPLVLVAGIPTPARADVTVSTATTGPVSGDGGAFTVTSQGSITSGGEGIIASGTSGITALDVAGSVDATGYGLLNHGGSTIPTVAVSGTLRGSHAVVNYGTIDALTNDRSMEGTGTWAIFQGFGGSLGTFSNAVTGTITGASNGIGIYATSGTFANAGLLSTPGYGVYVENASLWSLSNSGTTSVGGYAMSVTGLGIVAYATNSGVVTGARALESGRFATVDTITNSGTMAGSDYALVLNGLTNSLDNRAGGRIAATLLDGVRVEGRVMSLANSGTIAGGSAPDSAALFLAASGTVAAFANGGVIDGVRGLVVRDTSSVGSIDNSGTILGAINGVYHDGDGSIGALVNRSGGQITGTGQAGLLAAGQLGLLDNAGTIAGPEGIVAPGALGDLLNRAGGVVSGTVQAGLRILGTAGTVTNASGARIEGASAGVRIGSGGQVGALVNAGTITNIVNAGSLGDGTGPAITSSGAAASIGTLTNSGTVHGGLTVGNQDLVVHGGTTSRGAFVGGDITVLEGALTLASGSTLLASDVVVSSAGGLAGQGTLTNLATLALDRIVNLDGAFSQSGAGSFISILRGAADYGSIAATGVASLDGILGLEQDGHSLSAGQSYLLLSFASASGTFDGLTIDGVPAIPLGGGQWRSGGLLLSERWTQGTMALSVSSIPEIDPAAMGSVLALVAGALGLLERRRKRTA
jgi:hypothetical protein